MRQEDRSQRRSFIPTLEHSTATELATFVIALVTVAASPRPLPVDHGSEAQSVRSVVDRLRNAPSDREWHHLQDLTTTIEQNTSLWIGVESSERYEALSAVRNVLAALEPDPRRLAAPNLDPRRIAFIVVESARALAPADFAEAVTNDPDQAHLNVHVLRTMILRSLEHLQRVALREWTERNIEDRQSVRAAEVPSPMQLRPDPSNELLADRPPDLDLLADQLASMLAVELNTIGPAAPAADTPLPSTDRDLETDIKDALNLHLTGREPGFAAPSLLAGALESSVATEAAAAGLYDAARSRPAETIAAGEVRPVLAIPPSGAETPQPSVQPPSNLDLITDQLAAALAAELRGVAHAATASATPRPRPGSHTEIQKASGALNRREPGSSPTPLSLPDAKEASEVSVAPKAAPAGLPDTAQGLAAIATGAGTIPAELVCSTKRDRSASTFRQA